MIRDGLIDKFVPKLIQRHLLPGGFQQAAVSLGKLSLLGLSAKQQYTWLSNNA